jgi:Tol biopolymer transport system component/uncharacterized protein YjdB
MSRTTRFPAAHASLRGLPFRRIFGSFATLLLLVAIACSDNDPSSAPQGPAPVATVTVTPSAQTLAIGGTTTLTAALADAGGRPLSGRTIAWLSDRPDIATVTAGGVITAVAAGVANIDVASENKHATAVITVTRTPVSQVEITPGTLSLMEGETSALTAVAKDANGAVLGDRQIAWRSSDVTVAPVDGSGRVTALSMGTAAITAESEGRSATLQVTVRGAAVANVAVSPLTQPLEVGEKVSVFATLTDAQGRVLSGRTVTWSTSNGAVATIAANGQITAVGEGQVTLTATSEGKTGSLATVIDTRPSAALLYQRTSPLANEIFTLAFGAGEVPFRVNAGSVSHQPSVSGDGGRIAFYVSMTAPNGEIVEDVYAVDRNGLNMKRLTATPGIDNAPAWSPVAGANLIAYHHMDVATGRSDIWVMNADGSNARNLTVDLPRELTRGEPAWSPDGQWIAFSSSRGTAGPGRGSIWLMRADGSDKRQLTVHPGNGYDLSPSWSPDGLRIAFQRGGVSIVTVASGEVTNLGLPGTAIQPAWSPDGRHIAFAWQPSEPGAGDWQLYTVRADGTNMRLRTTSAAWGGGVSPTWITR